MKSAMTFFLATIIGLFTLTGCETFKGMGDDAENAGDEVEDATDDWD